MGLEPGPQGEVRGELAAEPRARWAEHVPRTLPGPTATSTDARVELHADLLGDCVRRGRDERVLMMGVADGEAAAGAFAHPSAAHTLHVAPRGQALQPSRLSDSCAQQPRS